MPGVWIDDELAVRESSVEVDGVLGGHHLVALAVHDEHRLVDAPEVRGLLLTPAVAQAQTAPWSAVSSPSPSSSFNFLDAATADKSSGQAWAVGYFENASSVFQTLTEFNP